MTETTKITIPRTIAAAERKLNSLGELATATEWERAAIVAAFVTEGKAGRPPRELGESPQLESARAFAERGIHGLTYHGTVLIYLNAWLSRFDRPVPGRSVKLPSDPWPPTALDDAWHRGVEDREAIQTEAQAMGMETGAKAVDIAKNPKSMQAAIKASPKVAAAAAEALMSLPVADVVAAKVMADPERAEVVIADRDVDSSVRLAQVRKAIGRPTPKPRPPRITGGPVATSRTLSIGMIEETVAEELRGWAGLIMEAATVPGYLETVIDGVSNRDSHLEFVRDFALPHLLVGLRACGFTEDDIVAICTKAAASLPSSVTVTDDELAKLLGDA